MASICGKTVDGDIGIDIDRNFQSIGVGVDFFVEGMDMGKNGID
jgi:hypothetical protein